MMRKMMFGFLVVVLSFSCSRTEPVIAFGFIELVYYQDRDGPRERFSFFIIPEDEDGIENLADLYLYHDWDQLRWHFSSDDWVSYTEGSRTWIGSRSIAIQEGGTLPRGQYRAILVNNGGERSERHFSFDAPEDPPFPFPTLTISQSDFTVNSLYPQNHLVCYDEAGNFLQLVTLPGLSGSLRDLDIPSQARTAALWAQDAERFTSAFTDVSSLQQ